jgi:hypothetical protein
MKTKLNKSLLQLVHHSLDLVGESDLVGTIPTEHSRISLNGAHPIISLLEIHRFCPNHTTLLREILVGCGANQYT